MFFYSLPRDILFEITTFLNCWDVGAVLCVTPSLDWEFKDVLQGRIARLEEMGRSIVEFMARVRRSRPWAENYVHPLSCLTGNRFNIVQYSRYMRWANHTAAGTAFVRHEYMRYIVQRYGGLGYAGGADDVYADPHTTMVGLNKCCRHGDPRRDTLLALSSPSRFAIGQFISTMRASELENHGI